MLDLHGKFGTLDSVLLNAVFYIGGLPGGEAQVHSRSVDPKKNCPNYLITRSILTFLTPHRSSSQRRSLDIYTVSAVGPKTKKLAVLP